MINKWNGVWGAEKFCESGTYIEELTKSADNANAFWFIPAKCWGLSKYVDMSAQIQVLCSKYVILYYTVIK